MKQILCIKLVKYRDKYTEMHGQQNVKTLQVIDIQMYFLHFEYFSNGNKFIYFFFQKINVETLSHSNCWNTDLLGNKL